MPKTNHNKNAKIEYMKEIHLSYLITTRNKLPYLRDRLAVLIEHKEDDEEIIVADAQSTDGTAEFLSELKQAGKIDHFISEADFGESHGLNKLELLANGTLLTIITDDDVFYFPAIKAIKKFMLEHSEIDITATEGGFKDQYLPKEVRPMIYVHNYQKWQKDHTPFSFCGLGIMIRKTSLPLLGLWDPAFRRADAEFSLRVTAGKARIAWYTGYSFVNISNPQSTSITHMKKIAEETERLDKFYLGKDSDHFLVKKLKVLKNKIRPHSGSKEKLERAQWSALVSSAEKWLERMSKEREAEFIWNE